jgi:tetratricopeptide (TPR) repeat protein
MYARATMRGRILIALALAGLLGACNTAKNESIKKMNAGIDYLNAKAYSPAERELEDALRVDPENAAAAYHLGEVFTRQKKWDKAVEPLQQAIKHEDKNPRYHFKLGETYFELGKIDLSRTELERSIALNQNFYMSHWLLGRINLMQERPKDAAVEWTTACKLSPTFGKSFFDLGKLYYEWDFLPQAGEVLERGTEHVRDPEDLTNIYYMLGLVYDGQKNWDKSITAYLAALDAKKDNLEARLQAGMAYANKGEKDKAKKYLDEYVRLAGGSSAAAFNIQAANERLMKLTETP